MHLKKLPMAFTTRLLIVPMAVGGNHTMIVGDQNVFLVDAGTTPAAARALLADMKLITDKPVRWVVNTHFHYDHTDGNSIFGPEVEIIGTEYVRHMIADEDVLHIEPFKTAMAIMPAQIEALKKQIGRRKRCGITRKTGSATRGQASGPGKNLKR